MFVYVRHCCVIIIIGHNYSRNTAPILLFLECPEVSYAILPLRLISFITFDRCVVDAPTPTSPWLMICKTQADNPAHRWYHSYCGIFILEAQKEKKKNHIPQSRRVLWRKVILNAMKMKLYYISLLSGQP